MKPDAPNLRKWPDFEIGHGDKRGVGGYSGFKKKGHELVIEVGSITPGTGVL
ncbi:MAG: hypothetical protein ACYC3N_11270 [Halothiobacillus sp.]